jgi:hypothetical protein
MANATTFTVGGKELEIPSPKGFSLVTQEMDAVYRWTQQTIDPWNDQLAFYIAESDVPIAMSGGMPLSERYYILKVEKKAKNMVVGSDEFAELKSITTQQTREVIKSVESQMRNALGETSKGIGKEFNIDIALDISQMVPLDPHYETDSVLAFSIYANRVVTVEGAEKEYIISGTTTFINVAGKILFLYCYGPKIDLEWTRSASKAWAAKIIENNPKPPSHSSTGIWDNVFPKALGGGLAALFFATILVVLSKLNKKKG